MNSISEGSGPFLFLNQAAHLTKANLKSRYRKTWAGFFWVVLNPLIMFGVQSLIFSKVLKLGIPNYYLFLLSGLIPWIFIVQTLEMCTPILQYSGSLLKAFPVHPLVYLFAQIFDNLVNFLAAFSIILIPLLFIDGGPLMRFALLPLPIATLVFGVSGMAWLLSTSQVFLRDTRYMITFILSISFFLTPIFFSIDLIPPEFRHFVAINPFYILIAPFQALVHAKDYPLFWSSLTKAVFLSSAILAVAALYWSRKRNGIYHNV